MRDVAEEIVVALDTSIDPDLAGPLVDVADVFLRYPYAEPVDRPVGWIHSLCTRDWIFWIDDDEIPSAALLRELPTLIACPDVTHYHIRRRWLWPDAVHALDVPPWSPDYQLRLVQNDSRLLWFPGITHFPIEAFGPHRFVSSPIYHTDLVLNTLDTRRAKVRRYEEAAPGGRAGGRPFNHAYYLPEARGRLDTSPVAGEDTERLRRLLGLGPWPTPRPRDRPARVAGREEIDAHWRGAPVGDDFYRARLSVTDELHAFSAGEVRGIDVLVENRGSHHWPAGFVAAPLLRLSYRWRSRDGKNVVVPEGFRTPLPEPLAPGSSLLASALVGAPPAPGSYVLELDLVHEFVRWFGCEVAVPVDVQSAPRIAIVGDDDHLTTEAASALADVAPEAVPILLVAKPVVSGDRHRGYATALAGHDYLGADSGQRWYERVQPALRTGALLSDALLVRWRVGPRFASGPGAAFLDVLQTVDALLVVGDAALSGSLGRHEAWSRWAAVLTAVGLGREVVVIARSNGTPGLRDRLVKATCRVVTPRAGDELAQALPNALRTLVENRS